MSLKVCTAFSPPCQFLLYSRYTVLAPAPMASKVIATQSQWHLASSAEEIAEQARRFCADVEAIERVPNAVQRALELAGEKDLVLVTGSFTVIGEVEV